MFHSNSFLKRTCKFVYDKLASYPGRTVQRVGVGEGPVSMQPGYEANGTPVACILLQLTFVVLFSDTQRRPEKEVDGIFDSTKGPTGRRKHDFEMGYVQ